MSSPLVFALPGLLAYGVFLVWPTIQSLWLSLTNWDGLSPKYDFVWFENYVRMLSDPTVASSLRNNLVWSLLTIVVPMVLGLALAVALNGASATMPFLRTIFYMPAVLPLVGVATIWSWLYDPSSGAINEALRAVGLEGLTQSWLGQDSTALLAVVVPAVWVGAGFPMLLYLAGLQSIPIELYESARTDGANPWQQFWHVTMPGLKYVHYIVLALSVIASLKVFDLIYAMTYGGPGKSTQVLGTWMYFNIFQYYDAGYGTAIAVFVTLLAVAVGIPYVLSETRGEK